MTYYVITDKEGKEPQRLVSAPNPSRAVRHVAKRYTATPATPADVVTLMSDGIKPEDASQTPDDEPPMQMQQASLIED